MTNEQAKICKIILRYKTIGRINKKMNIPEYLNIQDYFEPGMLDFSDHRLTDDTVVILSNQLMEELEERGRAAFRSAFTWILSICALIISIIALFRS